MSKYKEVCLFWQFNVGPAVLRALFQTASGIIFSFFFVAFHDQQGILGLTEAQDPHGVRK